MRNLLLMRWFKPNIKSSLYALLGHELGPSEQGSAVGPIRQRMLELLGEAAESEYATLARRLQFATEPETLWYARSELMGALARLHGEAQARKQVEALNPLFGGLLPDSLTRGIRQPA